MQESLFGNDEQIGDGIGDLEGWCRRQSIRWIVGVDEAGRGPLAGPVHAAAVALDLENLSEEWVDRLDDSKKLEESERIETFDVIRQQAPACAISFSSPETIDEINILQATRRAMKRCVEEVCQSLGEPPACVFVDGNVRIDVAQNQRTLVKGDGRSWAIAAASILAKVSRDEQMGEYHDRWPAYNFASNKGYPTAEHREALREHGPTPIHRRSFAGVVTD